MEHRGRRSPMQAEMAFGVVDGIVGDSLPTGWEMAAGGKVG